MQLSNNTVVNYDGSGSSDDDWEDRDEGCTEDSLRLRAMLQGIINEHGDISAIQLRISGILLQHTQTLNILACRRDRKTNYNTYEVKGSVKFDHSHGPKSTCSCSTEHGSRKDRDRAEACEGYNMAYLVTPPIQALLIRLGRRLGRLYWHFLLIQSERIDYGAFSSGVWFVVTFLPGWVMDFVAG